MPTSLYSICTVPVPIDDDQYLGNRKEFTQVHVQYPFIAMSLD